MGCHCAEILQLCSVWCLYALSCHCTKILQHCSVVSLCYRVATGEGDGTTPLRMNEHGNHKVYEGRGEGCGGGMEVSKVNHGA